MLSPRSSSESIADYPLLYEVSNHVVVEVSVLGSLVGHQAARHIHGYLVVHMDIHGCANLHELAQKMIYVQTVLAKSNTTINSGSVEDTVITFCLWVNKPTRSPLKYAPFSA